MYKVSLVNSITGDGTETFWEMTCGGKRDVEAFLSWFTKACGCGYTRRTVVQDGVYTVDYGSHCLFIKVMEIEGSKDGTCMV